VSDQVLHPYKTKGKIIFLYVLSLYFWIANWKKNILHRMIGSIP
jgi:hypothetical protein